MPSFLRSRQRWLTNVLFSFWLAIFFYFNAPDEQQVEPEKQNPAHERQGSGFIGKSTPCF